MNPTQAFSQARELLLRHRTDYDAAVKQFQWPQLRRFNWGIDWFDEYARGNTRTALRIVHDGGDKPREVSATFSELSERSTRVANWLHGRGVEKGDRVLVMLPNTLPLWEFMLGAMKLGAVIIPATTQLTREDLADRISRGNVRHAVAEASVASRLAGFDALRTRLVVGGTEPGWTPFDEARGGKNQLPSREPTAPDDPLLLYFTSGTTARPKLVLHTHQSYPVGHLSTMDWIGMREGDVHENISSPGWAKHAWSSFFAPWNAGATILVHDAPRFNAARTIGLLREKSVATLCCPPTVWRMLVLEDLGSRPPALRELLSAGEPLNPEVIEKVQRAWGVTIRDGYGQTETTAQIGNSPGQPIKLGSMGRALPGYQAALLDGSGKEAEEGEIALRLEPRPLGLMAGYLDDPGRTQAATAGGFYRTGDEASRDKDGYYTYVGRGDDVFKSSDYRISPFELESTLIEHPAVAEAAIIPSPDPLRFSVAKCFVVLKPEFQPSANLARDILLFTKERLAPYKRIRRLEFAELPKTISGKIRRVQLRALEKERRAAGERGAQEYWLEDFESAAPAPK
ncbi:MAG TPA: AMP-binding protein [Myxococcales bacterium]|nr:AMP-binding protein [Myxococcales bacterium]